jgi:hypothetical protein
MSALFPDAVLNLGCDETGSSAPCDSNNTKSFEVGGSVGAWGAWERGSNTAAGLIVRAPSARWNRPREQPGPDLTVALPPAALPRPQRCAGEDDRARAVAWQDTDGLGGDTVQDGRGGGVPRRDRGLVGTGQLGAGA